MSTSKDNGDGHEYDDGVLAPKEGEPATLDSAEALATAVGFRERIVDATLHDVTSRLTRLEHKFDTYAEASRLQTQLLVEVTKRLVTMQAAQVRIEAKTDLLLARLGGV